jgi:DNA mismatch repair ATPase MutS
MSQKEDASQSKEFSLLWPGGTMTAMECARTRLDPGSAKDLGLPFLSRAFTSKAEYQREILELLSTLCQDLEVIRYRQEVLQDLLDNPRLVEKLEALLPIMDALGRYSYPLEKGANTLHEVSWRMGELQSIIDCILGLDAVFQEIGDGLGSQGLSRLREVISGMRSSTKFQDLERELPDLMDRLHTCASLTIGVNLDHNLLPVEATLLSVNEKKFTSPGLLDRLIGRDHWAGIAPLHKVPLREASGPYSFPVDPELGRAASPLMVPLFHDLAKIIEKITQPIARELQRFTEIQGRMFGALRRDLVFYLGGLRMIARMRGHSLPVCRPQLEPIEARLCQVEETYNVNLALVASTADLDRDLSKIVVRNPLDVGPEGRILILTGPNQGGKTTYIQAAGLVQVLAQSGLYVPGTHARISLVDNIYTHFPKEEKIEAETGRFGDEAKRLGEIFHHITGNSLVLLNETLSSTSAGESLYLAQDVVRILRRAGLRAIYSTHLHELASLVDEINRTPGDSKVISLVASPVEEEPGSSGEIRRSYRIEARPPMGRSSAREIAARYGIGYSQLEGTLKERGVLSEGE